MRQATGTIEVVTERQGLVEVTGRVSGTAEAQQLRDEWATERLEDLGWTVVEVWEHESPEEALKRVLQALEAA